MRLLLGGDALLLLLLLLLQFYIIVVIIIHPLLDEFGELEFVVKKDNWNDNKVCIKKTKQNLRDSAKMFSIC